MQTKSISIEVNEKVLKKAEEVFNELGINTSIACNIFLTKVMIEKKIPFDADLERARVLSASEYSFELSVQALINEKIAEAKANGNPVALYDAELKKPYLEYPDGRREYDISKI